MADCAAVEDLSEPPQATSERGEQRGRDRAAAPRALVLRSHRLLTGVAAALAVALDDDQLVVLVEADVDGVAVGLRDLDLPGGAVLRIALDGVRVTAVVIFSAAAVAWSAPGPVAPPSPSLLVAIAVPAPAAARATIGTADDHVPCVIGASVLLLSLPVDCSDRVCTRRPMNRAVKATP